MWAGVPRVEFEVEFENLARDHRLRVVFPSGLKADSLAVETPFAVVQRSVDLPAGEGWADAPCAESPQQTFADVSDGRVGLALLNQGLPEVGVQRGDGGVEMALTLLRAVGWIARLHPAVAGYRIPTPEAQCLGKHTFRYALHPHAGDWQQGRVWEQAQRFAFPAAAYDAMPGTGTEAAAGLLSVAPSELVLSAVKRAEDGDDLIVRLWNVAPSAVGAEVSFGFPVRAAWLADLAEKAGEPLAVAGGRVSFEAGPCKIITLRVSPALNEAR